ncbi:MAG TPA: phospho-N-acetylmuramoyl-pentapeptide-transferase, partial [Patescibacteria group bacterium]|nr:phospho-N-acetylmuramoyl-pentapeptide-transferase [Patescibacteria group bacterium]
LRFRFKVFLYAAIGAIGAYWFYFKLGISSVFVPLLQNIDLSWAFLIFFVLAIVWTSFSVNQTDGLDGLAGGVLLINFLVMAIISYFSGRPNLAAMISVVSGALLAFLWFNVYPARFFMGDTGSMGLGILLAIVAFLNNAVYILPICGIIFMIEGASIFIQMAYKKLFGKKLFLSSPIHHHFEAYGWPETKVTMRFWIITAVFSLFSVVVFFTFKP